VRRRRRSTASRTATWHLDGVETAGTESLTLTLTLGLGDNDVGSQFWPEPFHAIYTVTFARILSLRLAVQNRAMHPITFEEAVHSYFAVSDVTAVAISGLGGTTYVDKTEGARRKQETAPLITVGAETDRVYLDTPARCAIEDRRWCRRVLIEKHGAASTWYGTPWAEKGAAMADLGDPIWRGMVCVETGNVADNEVRLAAGGEHQMSTAISVDAANDFLPAGYSRIGNVTNGYSKISRPVLADTGHSRKPALPVQYRFAVSAPRRCRLCHQIDFATDSLLEVRPCMAADGASSGAP
jgi:D-hexose-6-phosphate mutarotase